MHWSMMAVRGSVTVLLGLAVLVLRGVGLGELVVLFGIYALLDGICAAAWAIHASRRPLDGWPVLVEGVFSVGLGALALGHPFQSARFVHLVGVWGLVTGILEILGAVRFTRGAAARWWLASGGAWSVFGILVSVAAFRLQRVAPTLIGTVTQTGMTRRPAGSRGTDW